MLAALFARFDEVGGAQEAADLVGAEGGEWGAAVMLFSFCPALRTEPGVGRCSATGRGASIGWGNGWRVGGFGGAGWALGGYVAVCLATQ